MSESTPMMNRFNRNRRWESSFVNLTLVVGLAALAYAGHHYQWKIPSFSQLISVQRDSASRVEHAKDAAKTITVAGNSGAEDYPVIDFGTVEALQRSGIDTAPVIERELDINIQANSVVTYDQTRVAQLSSRVAGFVWSVNAQLGEFVHKGDMLAIIDSQEVGQAKADFLQEVAASTYKDRLLQKFVSGSRNGVIPDRTVREVEAAALDARIRRFNAQQRLINLGFDLDVNRLAELEPEQLGSQIQFLGIPNSLLAQFNPAPKTANLIPLFAPFDGVITQWEVVIGERITPDHSPVVMADTRSMWVRLSVQREHVYRLALGQRVRFTTDGSVHGAEGRLTWISTEVNEKTHTVQARAQVDNPSLSSDSQDSGAGPRLLRANEFGTATIRIADVPNALLVPEQAVQRDMDQTPVVFVLRPDGKSFEPRKVQLGETWNGSVHIRAGVQRGEEVAKTNSYVLKSELMRHTLIAEN